MVRSSVLSIYGKVISVAVPGAQPDVGPCIPIKLVDFYIDPFNARDMVHHYYSIVVNELLDDFRQKFPSIPISSIEETQKTKMPPNCTFGYVNGRTCIIEIMCLLDGVSL